MIYGIGVDTIEIERVGAKIRNQKFAERIFTPIELELPLPSIAARFAAREAAIKALRGVHGLSLRDFAVGRVPLGAPEFVLGEALETALRGLGVVRLHLSLTHDQTHATAFVVAEAVEYTGTDPH